MGLWKTGLLEYFIVNIIQLIGLIVKGFRWNIHSFFAFGVIEGVLLMGKAKTTFGQDLTDNVTFVARLTHSCCMPLECSESCESSLCVLVVDGLGSPLVVED